MESVRIEEDYLHSQGWREAGIRAERGTGYSVIHDRIGVERNFVAAG